MKFFLLAGVAAATLMAQAAEAATTNFTYTGSIVQWIVPTSGTFRIRASGAQGGNASYGGGPVYAGGRGVTISGLFGLRAGQQIDIAVGGAGESIDGSGAGGGGGGSFVLRGGSALIIAGGGGGAFWYRPGLDASSGANGVGTSISGGQAGRGGDGALLLGTGGGGAGLLSNGGGGIFFSVDRGWPKPADPGRW